MKIFTSLFPALRVLSKANNSDSHSYSSAFPGLGRTGSSLSADFPRCKSSSSSRRILRIPRPAEGHSLSSVSSVVLAWNASLGSTYWASHPLLKGAPSTDLPVTFLSPFNTTLRTLNSSTPWRTSPLNQRGQTPHSGLRTLTWDWEVLILIPQLPGRAEAPGWMRPTGHQLEVLSIKVWTELHALSNNFGKAEMETERLTLIIINNL